MYIGSRQEGKKKYSLILVKDKTSISVLVTMVLAIVDDFMNTAVNKMFVQTI